jgi:hypothetical protein
VDVILTAILIGADATNYCRRVTAVVALLIAALFAAAEMMSFTAVLAAVLIGAEQSNTGNKSRWVSL